MRNFILGIAVTLLGIVLFGLVAATQGLVPTNADAAPPRFERRFAMSALDASMEPERPNNITSVE